MFCTYFTVDISTNIQVTQSACWVHFSGVAMEVRPRSRHPVQTASAFLHQLGLSVGGLSPTTERVAVTLDSQLKAFRFEKGSDR